MSSVYEEDETELFNEKAHAKFLKDLKKLQGSDLKVERAKSVRHTTSDTTSSNVALGSVLKKLERKAVVKPKSAIQKLSTPLEKPVAKRIKRVTGFESVAVDLNRWEGIVDKNRKAAQLTFPLNTVDIRVTTTDKNTKPSLKSKLEQDVYSLLNGAKLLLENEVTEEEKEIQRAMSLKEIKLKSKELLRSKILRQRLEHKAALINKSKSRKYHKILKRDRLRKMKQDFERLKVIDPESAIELLNDIEKSRVQERMSLRHRKSKWVQAQSVRAAKDKSARDVLRENESMKSDLTEKLQTLSSKASISDSDEEQDLDFLIKDQQRVFSDVLEKNNAWSSQLALANEEVEGNDSSFLKMKNFWEDVHQRKETEREALKTLQSLDHSQEADQQVLEVKGKKEIVGSPREKPNNDFLQEKKGKKCKLKDKKTVGSGDKHELDKNGKTSKRKAKTLENEANITTHIENTLGEKDSSQQTSASPRKKTLRAAKSSEAIKTTKKTNKLTKSEKANKLTKSKKTEESTENPKESEKTRSKTLKKKKAKTDKSPISNAFQIDALFDEAAEKLHKKLEKANVNSTTISETSLTMTSKRKSLSHSNNKKKTSKFSSEISDEKDDSDLEFDFTAKGNDEGMSEGVERIRSIEDIDSLPEKPKSKSIHQETDKSEKAKQEHVEFTKIVSRPLGNTRPDHSFLTSLKLRESESEEEMEDDLRDLFEDDENIQQFRVQKASQEENEQPKDKSLFLHGWGSWAGPGIQPSQRKMDKFKIKAPSKPSHKYSKIGHVIYNEKADVHDNLRKVMVSEIPHPFLSVADFEASVQHPVGRVFVPEPEHRKLTAPPVVTKLGVPIPSMGEEALLEHHEAEKKSKFEKKLNEELKLRRQRKSSKPNFEASAKSSRKISGGIQKPRKTPKGKRKIFKSNMKSLNVNE